MTRHHANPDTHLPEAPAQAGTRRHQTGSDGPWIGDVARNPPQGGAVLLAEATRCAAWNAALPSLLAWVAFGRLEARIDGVALRLRGGQLLLAPPSRRSSLLLDPAADGTPPRLVALACPPLDPGIASILAPLGPIALDDPDLAAALSRLLHVIDAAYGDTTVAPALRELLAGVARHALRWHGAAARCPGRNDAARLAMLGRMIRARQAIDASDGASHGLARLAADAGLSKWHFLRVYRGLFGETPHQLASRRRFAAAQRLLYGSSLPIADIARELGFPDASSFGSFVRRHAGLSPGALRRLPAAPRVAPRRHRFPRTAEPGAHGASTA